MPTYYIAGFPYSDELYHSGVKGQRWGFRRFQNPDGSLTALGRIHYGVGNAVKKAAKHATDKIKDKHPWMMSDEELKNRMSRLDMEKKYAQSLTEINSKSKSSKFRSAVSDILTSSAKTLLTKTAENAAKKVAEKLLESSDEKRANELKEKADVYNRSIELMNAKKGYEKRAKEENDSIKQEAIKKKEAKEIERQNRIKRQEEKDAQIRRAKQKKIDDDRYGPMNVSEAKKLAKEIVEQGMKKRENETKVALERRREAERNAVEKGLELYGARLYGDILRS